MPCTVKIAFVLMFCVFFLNLCIVSYNVLSFLVGLKKKKEKFVIQLYK